MYNGFCRRCQHQPCNCFKYQDNLYMTGSDYQPDNKPFDMEELNKIIEILKTQQKRYVIPKKLYDLLSPEDQERIDISLIAKVVANGLLPDDNNIYCYEHGEESDLSLKLPNYQMSFFDMKTDFRSENSMKDRFHVRYDSPKVKIYQKCISCNNPSDVKLVHKDTKLEYPYCELCQEKGLQDMEEFYTVSY